MVRFALIGAGFIGSVHATNLARHANVRFDLVADSVRERAERISREYGARVAAVDEVFSSNVDAILIASSTDTHSDMLERAAVAHKAVYCEKPVDLDIARARKAHVAVKKSGIPCMIGFNRRFDESHAAVHAAIAAGEIGAIELVQLTNRGPSVPALEYLKISGGQMRDQTIHFFDLLRFLTDDDPLEVYAAGAALASEDVGKVGDVDTSVVTLRMRSGALCQIDSIRRTGYGYDERVEVCGAEGMVESTRQPYRHMTLHKGRSAVADGFHAGWFERMQPTYGRALDAFISSLLGGDTRYPGVDDGLAAQAIAEAAASSLVENRPIQIEYH